MTQVVAADIGYVWSPAHEAALFGRLDPMPPIALRAWHGMAFRRRFCNRGTAVQGGCTMECVTRIHHMNCASFTPNLGLGLGFPRRMVSHCLVREREEGLTLIDSGFGTADTHGRVGRPYALALGARLNPAEPAVTQLKARRFDPGDVRDIVLTHLDLDHAGGISDFPAARIHVSASEHAAGMTPRFRRERFGYIAAQWAHAPNWKPHEPQGDRWLDFDAIQWVKTCCSSRFRATPEVTAGSLSVDPGRLVLECG